MAETAIRGMSTPVARKRLTMRKFAHRQPLGRRRAMVSFLMALPLIVLIAALVIYPALYSIHLATLNKSMQRFVGFDNFTFLFKRATFWMVVRQSCIFAVSAVFFKALIGFF